MDDEQLRADAREEEREGRIMRINMGRLSRVNSASEVPPVLICTECFQEGCECAKEEYED